ncbi:MAG: cyclopropane-fatty-acyl-phospholipid synthase [Alphaproteobacteria bacterium]|jgi:cyclopropane-fatty-acyl-phospholipid synthase
MTLSLDNGVAKQSPKFAALRWLPARAFHSISAYLLSRLTLGLEAGSIMFIMPDGRELHCRGQREGADAVMRFHSYAGIFRLCFGGYIGLGEGYVAGDWSTPSLRTVFQFGLANQESLEKRLSGKVAVRLLSKVLRIVHSNSMSGSRRNIAYHYDLGNAFYERWLDPSMTYSSGIFGTETTLLEEAQAAKYRRIVESLNIESHHRILEIGCGWGGFAEFVARETGASVTAITVSQEQYDYTVNRIARAGLQDQVDIQLKDYRALSGQYDRVVSIEMLEAVGETYWPGYFRIVNESLTEDGQAIIQVITVADERFDYYRSESDFVQRHIFPGGMLLSPGEMDRQSQAAGMVVKDAFFFGSSYGCTLDHWYDRFSGNWSHIETLGFDYRFCRLWSYYLNYTAAGFHAGTIDVGQFLLTKSR